MIAMSPPSLYVHLDLKGLPLSPNYLCDIVFPLLKKRGVTGILLEWEDMLPFSGSLADVACADAFTPAQVARIVNRAQSLGLEIIPLVQTIGHLEYVLKHESRKALREDELEFGTICPTDPNAHALLDALISQVLAFHPHCRRLHIGCDEPTLTRSKGTDEGGASTLIAHVSRTVAAAKRFTQSRSAPLDHVLMWHDAAVGMSNRDLLSLLQSGASLVVWDYTPSLSDRTRAFVEKLPALGERLALGSPTRSPLLRSPPFYIASAYKGAEACDSLIPDLSARLGNQRVWSAFNAGLGKGFDARRGSSGVVLTDWSRFGHSMPLCEMFPAGVPSLLRSIALWKGEDDNAADKEVAAWRREDPSGAKLHDLCVALDKARSTLQELEAETRQCDMPTLRAPSPRRKLSLEERAKTLAEELLRLQEASVMMLEVIRGEADGRVAASGGWRRVGAGGCAAWRAPSRPKVWRSVASRRRVRGGCGVAGRAAEIGKCAVGLVRAHNSHGLRLDQHGLCPPTADQHGLRLSARERAQTPHTGSIFAPLVAP